MAMLRTDSEHGLLQNTDGCFFEQILFRMRHCYQSRFGWMLEVMMAAPDAHQKPPVCHELSD
ncbi:hypothetical protein AEQ63_07745 [Pseudomonas sp. RIT-PI-o]|nr:hypothetical protein AEQ63_07745 [Pseudomonas sp. RIT-PI-o]